MDALKERLLRRNAKLAQVEEQYNDVLAGSGAFNALVLKGALTDEQRAAKQTLDEDKKALRKDKDALELELSLIHI